MGAWRHYTDGWRHGHASVHTGASVAAGVPAGRVFVANVSTSVGTAGETLGAMPKRSAGTKA